LSDKQCGFKAHHSTSMAILRLVDQITSEIDEGIASVKIIIDLSKAFIDTIIIRYTRTVLEALC